MIHWLTSEQAGAHPMINVPTWPMMETFYEDAVFFLVFGAFSIPHIPALCKYWMWLWSDKVSIHDGLFGKSGQTDWKNPITHWGKVDTLPVSPLSPSKFPSHFNDINNVAALTYWGKNTIIDARGVERLTCFWGPSASCIYRLKCFADTHYARTHRGFEQLFRSSDFLWYF